MKTVLSIAGSDCSAGAGIQADIKTMLWHDVYATTVITAVTAQNTLGVQGVYEVSPRCFEEQLESIFSDLFPDAIKIGMLSSSTIISILVQKLKQYPLKNIVLDPIMLSSSGKALLEEDALITIQEELFPLVNLITPNIRETEFLVSRKIHNEEDMKEAAQELGEKFHSAILCKGGHQEKTANDVLYWEGKFYLFSSPRIENPNNHGTGCTLSSAIAANLAKGETLNLAVKKAKDYISACLRAGLNLGQGVGPLNHKV